MLFGFNHGPKILYAPDPAPAPGGPTPTPSPAPAAPTPDDIKAENERLKKELEALRKPAPAPTPTPAPEDLATKAAREREEAERKGKDSKTLESALKFTMGSKDFLKSNDGLLPKNVAGIFEQADKETYSSAVEKAADIKVGLVQEFFALQENLDLLTDNQKSILAEFKKLAKDIKHERVQEVYDSLFEPALERARAVRKATQLRNGGGQATTDADAAYRERMKKISEGHYIRNGRSK